MGEVYRAYDNKLEQPVALKFLPASMSRDEPGRARFHNEVRIARQVPTPRCAACTTSANGMGCRSFPWNMWVAKTWRRCSAVSAACPPIKP
jgi:serine/threonine protein kinase